MIVCEDSYPIISLPLRTEARVRALGVGLLYRLVLNF
jgi:hypothetical protein